MFTGTPGGVGIARKPARLLAPGEELISRIEGVGEMRHTFRGDATPESFLEDAQRALEQRKG